MSQTEWKWSTTDGLRLFAREWGVENPRMVIALVHGMGEHCSRYQNMADYFNRRDVALMAYDQRGHGRSEGQRGHTPSIDLLLEDVGRLVEKTRQRYPGIPVFLYGHSMGGNLVLSYLLKRLPADVNGVIASAPWIQLAFQPPAWRVILGRYVRNIFPALSQPNAINVNHICRVPAVVKAYEEDPLVHDRITPAMGVGLLEQADWLDRYQGETPIPLLIMHGTGDQITSPRASASFADRVGGEIEYKAWEGFYHEIHHEEAQEEVFAYTLRWMERW